ncbi:invasion associated locus B family protein [uncultured Methylobacterium sp.]|uniref:invasion associated locus B family protein n=1 Tax=uncultured Methylobacterium sp. TaxID=157278 RepID=UPI0035CB979D
MSPIRASRRPAILAAVLVVLAPAITPCAAQEEAPAGNAEAAPKPRPKPRAPAQKPAPKATPAPAPAATAKPAAIWPAGALSISESYGDWTLTCARSEAATSCMLMQSQGDNKTGKRQFAIELRSPKDGRSEGLILMPFGLAIDPGVTFKLDDVVLGKGAPYVSCSGEGCLVPISFPTLATDAMRTAKTLVVIGQKPGTDEPQPISVPLGGFAPVWDRAIAFGG